MSRVREQPRHRGQLLARCNEQDGRVPLVCNSIVITLSHDRGRSDRLRHRLKINEPREKRLYGQLRHRRTIPSGNIMISLIEFFFSLLLCWIKRRIMFARRSIFIFLHCNWARLLYISKTESTSIIRTSGWRWFIFSMTSRGSFLFLRYARPSFPSLFCLLFSFFLLFSPAFLFSSSAISFLFSPLLCAKTISFRFSKSSWLTDRVRTVLFLKAQERSIVPSVVRGYFFQEAFRLSNDLPCLLFRRRVAHE